MRRTTTLVVLTLCTRMAVAQVPSDSVRLLYKVGLEARRVGARYGESMWPGFRPDTIPVSFVLPSRGDLLMGWKTSLPEGYVAVPGLEGAAWRDRRALGAASTATTLGERRVAQVAVQSLEPATFVATALHEAFHAFEAASRTPTLKFGRGENSILISTYPVFDVENEAAFALEGILLASALDATTLAAKRMLAREFVAARRARHRKLPVEFVEFEELSELNEGLAEYIAVRALEIEAREGPPEWRAEATRSLASHRVLLRDVTGTPNLSLRYRFYHTGPAQGLLLDALAGPSWKKQLVSTNSTLQDMLALASGLDSAAVVARARAEARVDIAQLRRAAGAQIEQLKTSRRARVDSVLSAPGIRLVLVADSLPGRDFNACGYDPQNLLQVTPTLKLHARWWRPCAGGPTYAEFNVPSVHDATAGSISAVIGPETDVKLSANGAPIVVRDGETMRDVRTFKLDAPRASVQAVRADVSRAGNTITVRPKTP